DKGTSLRVVSMPCVDVFLSQDTGYHLEVLGEGMPIASVEAASTWGWDRITRGGLTIGIDGYGASAPYEDLAEHYGLTPRAVADRISRWLAGEAS
ncbi:MAG: transketolase, partial [Acidimicrobiia bacterium]|nr:transketolase [Acidimicrobiia bacterium]